MVSNWLETESIEDTQQFNKDFWTNLRKGIENGSFWADQIKGYKNKPYERLQVALNNLPLPAAFREAAIALRSIIREKKKNNLVFNNELKLIYWLAAIDSFTIPSSEICNCPGYNIIESIPGNEIKSLSFDYDTLGYKHLKLLKPTDIKWLVFSWGEPSSHTTLHDLYHSLWHQYELEYLKKNQGLNINFSSSRCINSDKNQEQKYFSFNHQYIVIVVIILISITLIIFN